jgi:hypothetical protein
MPVFVMLVFGMVQFGLYFSQGAGLATGARSGARLGSVNLVTQTTCSGVIEATRSQTTGLGLPMGQVKVTVSRGTTEAGSTPICSKTGTAALTPSASATALPCELPSTSVENETLYVKAEYSNAGVSLPLVGKWNLPLSTTGAYRCEYR